MPSPAEEAVRDLVRARGDLLDDRKRMQQRLNAMLLRHGRVWRGGKKWTYAHRTWVDRQVFDEPALAEALELYRGGLGAREADLAAAEARLAAWAGREPLAGPVARLGDCPRGCGRECQPGHRREALLITPRRLA